MSPPEDLGGGPSWDTKGIGIAEGLDTSAAGVRGWTRLVDGRVGRRGAGVDRSPGRRGVRVRGPGGGGSKRFGAMMEAELVTMNAMEDGKGAVVLQRSAILHNLERQVRTLLTAVRGVVVVYAGDPGNIFFLQIFT